MSENFDIKNFTDPFKVLNGVLQAKKILKKEKPDIIFSKGGFVAVPVVIAASIKKIPVVDLKDGQAVSGKSGLRDTYQPLQTVFAPSSDPIEIAQGLKLNGADELYIADLGTNIKI